MKKIICLAAIALLLFSCGSKKQSDDRILSPANLRTQTFTIDPTLDTTLFGMRGGIFSIKKGSFDGHRPVHIEIKEVYSMAEILYAGLTTESDRRLLESGGMVYLNAKRDGKQVALQGAIDVSIPAHYVNDKMQLFKGEEEADGNINWVDPQPLDTSAQATMIDTSGKTIFMAKCASCHSVFNDGTGPALAGVEERIRDRSLLRAFIRDPGGVMADNLYFLCQKQKFGSLMTAFPDLSDSAIDALLSYVKTETLKRPDLLPLIEQKTQDAISDTSHYSSCLAAPCGFDTIYVDTTEYHSATGNMVDMYAEATKEDSMDYLYKNPDSLEQVMRQEGFRDLVNTEGRYNFAINTLGWFNVDAFYEGMDGTSIVDLFVKTDFEPASVDVHVFFPARKLLTVGVFHGDDSLYHFEKYKGQIPLFLNDMAVAFGVASIGEKIYYGVSAFKVSRNQTIPVKMKETTKEALTKAFVDMNIDGIDLDIITKKRVIIPKVCGAVVDSIIN